MGETLAVAMVLAVCALLFLAVADLFAGAIFPGFVLVLLYILIGVAAAMPEKSPAIAPDPKAPRGLPLAARLVTVLVASICEASLRPKSPRGTFISALFHSCSFSSPCWLRSGSRRGLRPGCRIGFMGRD